MATTLLDNDLFDQQALAEIYARAYTKAMDGNYLHPETLARRAVLDFCELLTENRDDD